MKKTRYSKRSDAFAAGLKLVMKASFKEALDVGQSLADEEERVELHNRVLFQTGQIQQPAKPGRWKSALWSAYCRSAAGRIVLTVAFRVLAVAFVALQGFAWARRSQAELNRICLHARYTDFINGIILSLFLREVEAVRGNDAYRLYYDGCLALFECLSGRFDLGIERFARSVEELESLYALSIEEGIEDAPLYGNLLQIKTLAAMYLSFSGDHDRAYAQYEDIFAMMKRHGDYFFIWVYIHSMRMFSDLEMLDGEKLQQSAGTLQKFLGQKFSGQYALRASIFAGLIAAVNRDYQFARGQIHRSAQHYNEQVPTVERSRYHFMRALIAMESSDVNSALYHMDEAKVLLAVLPGAVLHSTDAALTRIEIFLRGRLRRPLDTDSREVRAALSSIRKLSRRVRGNRLVAARATMMEALALRLLGSHDKMRAKLRGLDIGSMSKRLDRVLAEFDPTHPGHRPVATSESEVDRQASLQLLDEITKLTDASDLVGAGGQILSRIIGVDEWQHEFAVYADNEGETVSTSSTQEFLMVELKIQDGQILRYSFARPVLDLNFEVSAKEQIKFVGRFLRHLMMQDVEREAERNAAIAQMTRMIVHDIRRPFSLLKATFGALKTEFSSGKSAKLLSGLEGSFLQASGAVEEMLADILELGQKAPITMAPVALGKVVESALHEIAPDGRPLPIKLSVNFGHHHQINADHQKLRRVFANIIDNAVQATPAAGRVWIESRDRMDGDEPSVEIVIGNSGSYIPPEIVNKIFRAFFTKKEGGTGLGLAIAERIVAHHGGKIRVESDPETGTRFVVSIPRLEIPCSYFPSLDREAVSIDRGGVHLNGRQVIAVVEDDPFLREIWTSHLAGHFAVLSFEKPSDLIKEIGSGAHGDLPLRIDAVFTDYYFTNDQMNGSSLRSFFSKMPKIPVAVMTDSPESVGRVEGFARVWGKVPPSIDSVEDLLRSYL